MKPMSNNETCNCSAAFRWCVFVCVLCSMWKRKLCLYVCMYRINIIINFGFLSSFISKLFDSIEFAMQKMATELFGSMATATAAIHNKGEYDIHKYSCTIFIYFSFSFFFFFFFVSNFFLFFFVFIAHYFCMDQIQFLCNFIIARCMCVCFVLFQ